jgi:hypothetical protein
MGRRKREISPKYDLKEWTFQLLRFLVFELRIVDEVDELGEDFSNVHICLGGAFQEARAVLGSKFLPLLRGYCTLARSIQIKFISNNNDRDLCDSLVKCDRGCDVEKRRMPSERERGRGNHASRIEDVQNLGLAVELVMFFVGVFDCWIVLET